MSIMIMGMEMPKNCLYCHFVSYDNDRCVVIDKDIPIYGTKPSWCPLVPLPAGHGRLIDAEAFVDYMQNRYDNNEITNGDWIDFRLSLKDQPTIVPAKGETDNA